jgi:hypothetical protein
MEREDPLERIERKERERKQNGGAKTVMFIMIAVAVLLGAALAYVLWQKNSLVGQLNLEKQELTEQIVALQSDYESLSSEYDAINLQLDSSREEVAQLVERIKKTEATDRAKIRQYEKELGTLRTIMRGYIVQIDSLNQLNHKLTVDAANARREAAEHRKRSEELTAQVEDLTGKVVTGSVIKARGMRIEAYNSAGKVIDRSKNVARLLVTLSLVENALAESGPVRVYVRVKDPNGNLLDDGRGASFTLNGQTLPATASREVDYQGQEVELSIYVNNIPAYEKGIYTAEAYTSQAKLGSAELMLR